MKPDDFENRLRRNPFRPVPAEWREDILRAAAAASSAPVAPRPTPGFLSTLNSRLSAIFWPNPAAWAGLAAVWLLIFVVNYASIDPSELMAGNSKESPADLFMALQQQQQEVARLTEPVEVQPAEPPKPTAPRPRGELRNRITFG